MPDLINRKRAETVKIVGADPNTGDESTFLSVDSFGSIISTDSPITSGAYKNLLVSTTPIELKVGALKLSGRKFVSVQPKGKHLYYGYDNTVTVSTGTEVFKNQTLYIPVGPNQQIWLISDDSAGIDVRITEI